MKTIHLAAIGFKCCLEQRLSEQAEARQRILESTSPSEIISVDYFPTLDCFRAIENHSHGYDSVLCTTLLRLNPECSQKETSDRVLRYCRNYAMNSCFVYQNRNILSDETKNKAFLSEVNPEKEKYCRYNWSNPSLSWSTIYFWLITKSKIVTPLENPEPFPITTHLPKAAFFTHADRSQPKYE